MSATRWLIFAASLWITAILFASGSSMCPPLPYVSLPNGKIVPTGAQKFQFECDRGYFLGGTSEIRCYKGNWTTEKAPKCYELERRCDAPSQVPNSDVIGYSAAELDSIVQYICHPGYVMLGNGMRICLRSGYWSGITPACMNESEPLQTIAERLDNEFITKFGADGAKVQQAYYLDSASVRKGLDLVILVDRSTSVDPLDLNIGKEFIKFLFREFRVKNTNIDRGARAAVIAFGTNVDILFNLNDTHIESPEAANAALDELLKPNGGGTAMVPALASVFLKVEPHLRGEVKRALFLISDGEPNIGGEGITPADMAKQLKEYADFEIFTVGIGADINRQTLASVASEPVLNHVFMLKKYSDLAGMMSIIKNRPTKEPPIGSEKCGHMGLNKGTEGWPWMAVIYVSYETENSTQLKLCGGVLICSQWVLTSASCFFNVRGRDVNVNLREAFVSLGESNLIKMDPAQRNFYAMDVIIHPDYDPFLGLLDNLALIQLNSPAPLDLFRPVCLPPTDKTIPLHLDMALNASVAGWGSTAPQDGVEVIKTSVIRFELAIKTVTLADGRECRKIVNRNIPENSIFCAESGRDSCLGIPGSPVVAEDPRTGYNHVLGILSQRRSCARGYSQYVELRKYIPWINDMTQRCHFTHWN